MRKYHFIAMAATVALGSLGAQDMQRRAVIGRGPEGI
jgi:hypothetical protein